MSKGALGERNVGRGKIEKAIAKIKCGKAAGIDRITPEMLEY